MSEAAIDLPAFQNKSPEQRQDNQKNSLLTFPTGSQVGTGNQVGDKLVDDHPAHDPAGKILEKNVMETQRMLQEQAQRVGHTHTANPKPNTLERIRIILKHKGLDSQQMDQAMKEIEQVLKEE